MADLHTLTSMDILRTQCQLWGFPLAIKEDHDNRVYRFSIDRGERGKLTGWFQYASPSGLPLVFDNFTPPILCSVAEQLDSVLRQFLRRGPVVGVALEDAKPIPGTDPPQYELVSVAVSNHYGDGLRHAGEKSPDLMRVTGRSPFSAAPIGKPRSQESLDREDARIAEIQLGNVNFYALSLEKIREVRDQLNTIIYDKERGQCSSR